MDNNTKKQIVDELRKYVLRFDSQNKAADELKNISVANVSNMLNGKWDKISDEKWRTVEKQLKTTDWVIVPTTSFDEITEFYNDAASGSLVFPLILKASHGKSIAAKEYKSANKNVSVVTCEKAFTRRILMIEILTGFGIDVTGLSSYKMSKKLINYVLESKKPLIILDEADKMNVDCLCYFITLFNNVEEKCGIIMQATSVFEDRFKKGLMANRPGYSEAFSRLDTSFIHIDELTTQDFHNVIVSNGISDENVIYEIINDCNSDLRRVKKLVRRAKKMGGK